MANAMLNLNTRISKLENSQSIYNSKPAKDDETAKIDMTEMVVLEMTEDTRMILDNNFSTEDTNNNSEDLSEKWHI